MPKAAGTPVLTMLRNIPIVEATIDGQKVRLVLDTGSESTFLSSTAAHRLGLRPDGAKAQHAQGVGGVSLNYSVKAATFRIGDVTLPDPSFSVGTMIWELEGPPPDGYLGSDVLATLGVDLDFPNGHVLLYQPAAACVPTTPPWDGPYTVLPLQPSPAGLGLFQVPIRLEGQRVSATLDTGAEFTTVAMSTARALGISSGALGRDPRVAVFGFGPNLQTSRIHHFRDVTVGDEVTTDVPLIVADLPPLSGDILLGDDFLGAHRVYLSYATQQMFISRSLFLNGPQAQSDTQK